MTTDEYLKQLFQIYSLVTVLSQKNGCKVLRLRNIEKNKDLVVHCFPKPINAYEELCKISCENLPLIYDVINLSDGQIVLEEYIDGITVADIMKSGKYRYIGARKVIKSVCKALDVLHQRGFVHRDVKPENIIIDKNGRTVLIDFNASRKVSYALKDTVIMGTVGYASPEQMGISQTDCRTDVYAVGVLLNVMLTGSHPSEKLSHGKAGMIVRKCTNINPNNRFQTVKKLYNVL